ALVNIAVPSLVAFPAGYKILGIEDGVMTVRTVTAGPLRLDRRIRAAYRAEAETAALPARLLDADDYGGFLWQHIGHLTGRRQLKRHWPPDLAARVRGETLARFAGPALAGSAAALVE